MFKSPERIFSISMWVVSWIFASFLIGLGNNLIADIPSVTTPSRIENYVDKNALAILDQQLRVQYDEKIPLTNQRDTASAKWQGTNNEYIAAQNAHRNWLGTRSVTANNPESLNNDKELQDRTRALDTLSEKNRTAQNAIEVLEQQLLAQEQTVQALEQQRSQMISQGTPEFQKAQRSDQLKIFGLRLMLTLPLIGVAAWLIRHKRKSAYWPLARGFVIFSGFAFFFELVPYLPSYGGYVRYMMGIILCIVGGHYSIREMQAYLIRRQEESKRNEAERRSKIDSTGALLKMDAGLCPGCDRKIPNSIDSHKVNHCVHCGLTLYVQCEGEVKPEQKCGARNNAFYLYCPTCGTDNKKRSPLTALHGVSMTKEAPITS